MQRGISAGQWAAIRALREDAVPTFSLLAEATGCNVSTIRERAAREGWRKQPFPSAVQRKARETILERCRQDARGVLAWAEGRMTVLALLAAAEQEAEDAAGRGGGDRENAAPGESGQEVAEAPVAGGEGAGREAGRAADPTRAAPAGAHLGGAGPAADDTLLAEKLEKLGGLLARQVDAIVETAEFAGARLDRPGLDEIAALLRLSEKALALSGPARAAEDGQETRSDEELAAMLALLDERVVELARLHAEWLVGEKDRQGG